jgi:hypothetical protein
LRGHPIESFAVQEEGVTYFYTADNMELKAITISGFDCHVAHMIMVATSIEEPGPPPQIQTLAHHWIRKTTTIPLAHTMSM